MLNMAYAQSLAPSSGSDGRRGVDHDEADEEEGVEMSVGSEREIKGEARRRREWKDIADGTVGGTSTEDKGRA